MTSEDLLNLLKKELASLNDAYKISLEVLKLTTPLKKIWSRSKSYENYFFYLVDKNKISRPINSNLYIDNINDFKNKYLEFKNCLKNISKFKKDTKLNNEMLKLLDCIPYTIGINIGIGADIILSEQEAKKNVGERFKELVDLIFKEIGILTSREIKYGSYVDIVLGSPLYGSKPVLVSVKTTSKDRFKIIFKEKNGVKGVKYICVFLHDVQRVKEYRISKTFVPKQFLKYYEQNPLDGVYYMDPPPEINKDEFKDKIKRFSTLLVNDIWKLLE